MSFSFPSPLYAIVDPLGRTDVDPVELGERMLAGGARLLQLRWKDAATDDLVRISRELARRAAARGATFLVNDRADVALAAGADGVHLGQDDLPVDEARKLLGGDRIIGLSTHTLEQALAADGAAVDYLGFGPIFATATKATGYEARGLATLAAVRARVRRPLVAIGGIRLDTAPTVLAAGADAVAMISELMDAAEPEAAVKRALDMVRDASTERPENICTEVQSFEDERESLVSNNRWSQLQASIDSCQVCVELGQTVIRRVDQPPERPPAPKNGVLLFISEAPPVAGGFWRAAPNADDLRAGLFGLLREAGVQLPRPQCDNALDEFRRMGFSLLQTVKWPLKKSAARLGPGVRPLVEHCIDEHLSAELDHVRPRGIICLGKVASYGVSRWSAGGSFNFTYQTSLDSVRGRFSAVTAPRGEQLAVFATALPVSQNLRDKRKRRIIAQEISDALRGFDVFRST